MDVIQRIELLTRLGKYVLSNEPSWQAACETAHLQNSWFTPEFIQLSTGRIAENFLQTEWLSKLAETYMIPHQQPALPRTVGIVMAGNIPLVGFHDFLCVFLTGHRAMIKLSSKDQVLFQHLMQQLQRMEPSTESWVSTSDMLKGCYAYIATGSNNSARYFDYYFAKYPHIIRRNRTSVAVITGNETSGDLENLADDVHQYFGLGCRNVTKLYVPQGYDFMPMLEAFKKYDYLLSHQKYKNNYDYQLAVLIINKGFYMTNGSLILRESNNVFSPISQLNYEFYHNRERMLSELERNDNIQCIVGEGFVPFGQAQKPSLTDFADKVDTLQFLLHL